MRTFKLIELKGNLFSEDWDTSLHAADLLAKINTNDAISILIDGLKSDNNFIRNASAIGIRDTNNKTAFDALWNRIAELGPNEEIGTLVYSMELADCRHYLYELLELFFAGNFEVTNSVTTIIEQQVFYLTDNEHVKISELLDSKMLTFNKMKIKFNKTNEA